VKPFLIASLLLLASCSRGGTPDIQIADAWARETVAGQTGTAAYMHVENRGSGTDRLVAVSAQAPVTATIHETVTSDGISSMRPLEGGLEIPAGETVVFKPGGAHLMISGLAAPLHERDSLKLKLRFERSGEKDVDFKVASAMNGAGH
jgi:copper(I)-binding protein